ncbi:hypothetical protein ACFJGV_00535 [Cnuibacter sp. UC19_7]|uniref:hypothetical protein n=1 Tax=Cnuibacter sp. UC19_7 TaxID=3350166 RepID=UPI00366D3CD2
MPDETAPVIPLDADGDFDVREFARTAVGTYRSSLDLDSFQERRLSALSVQMLSYLREVERATLSYLRNVLVTPTHKDARVTAFLTTWAFEKFWISDALGAVAEAHGVDPRDQLDHARGRAVLREIVERATPIVESFRANAIGPDVVGVHLATVAIDDRLSEAAYRNIAAADPHPELLSLVERILAVKRRHLVFVEKDADDRLARSRRARSLARRALSRLDWPIGARDLRPESTATFFDSVVDAPTAAELDARVDLLPGLKGLGLITHARVRAATGGVGLVPTAARSLGRAAASLRHGKNHG